MAKLSDKSVKGALNGDSVVHAPVKVQMQGKNGKPARTVKVIKTEPPLVRDEVVRIVYNCDPIGFLCDVVNGSPIETHLVEKDGSIKTIYESPSLQQRISAARYLADKYMPKVSQVAHTHLHKVDEAGDERSFAQIVSHAASRVIDDDESEAG